MALGEIMDMSNSAIAVKRLAGALGAEVSGIDLATSKYDNVYPAIHQAFLDHAVIVLRRQNLSPEQLASFSRKFGQLESHVLDGFHLPGNPEVLVISNVKKNGKPIGAIYAGQYWHSDTSFTKRPTQASLLHALELPSCGGDTMFTNMSKAYEQLSETMKAFVGKLTAVHDYTNAYDTFFSHLPDRPPLSDEAKSKVPPVTHPVVRVHPDTGAKALYVNPGFTRRINELSPSESRALLDYLFQHCRQPHLTYRHHWELGDLLIWDNRCTCHLAIADYNMSENRHLIRCSIQGEVPAGIDAAN